MNSNSPVPTASCAGSTDAAPRAAKPARTWGVISVNRMQGLETAAKLLGGQRALGDQIGVEPRSLRAKITADRGITDSDLSLTIGALESKARRLLAHDDKLRAEMAA